MHINTFEYLPMISTENSTANVASWLERVCTFPWLMPGCPVHTAFMHMYEGRSEPRSWSHTMSKRRSFAVLLHKIPRAPLEQVPQLAMTPLRLADLYNLSE